MNTKVKNQLAKELNANLQKLNELNESYKISFDKLQALRTSILKSKHQEPRMIKNLNKEHEKCQDLCEQRMLISNQSYFLLENEIKKVNNIIERLELEQDTAKLNGFSYQNYLIDKNYDEFFTFDNFINQKKKSRNKKTKNLTSIKLNIKRGKEAKRKRGKTLGIKKKKEDDGYMSNLEDITYKEIDGKIGPEEQIYCFCNYVSYGKMVKCDNPKCEKEWFHFHCVGLRNLPKGKWFCSQQCADEYRKNTSKKN